MKRNTIIAALLLISTVMFGQQREHHASKRVEHRTTRMKFSLGLNEEQTAKVKSLNEKYAKTMPYKRDSTKNKEDLRKARLASAASYKKDLKEVLTPEQYAKWTEMQAKQQNERKDKRKAHQGNRAEKLKTELSLTDEQVKKVENVNGNFKKRTGSLHKNEELSKEVKQAEFKKVKSDYHTEMKNILTDDQYVKWKELMAQRKEKFKDKGYKHSK